jgi:hypothetical protein
MSEDEMLKLADEAERIASGATPGPWHIGPYYKCDVHSPHQRDGRDYVVHGNTWSAVDRADAPFIAASRTLVPLLASALRQAVTENRELRQRLFDEVSDGNGLRNLINDQGEEIRKLQARVRELERPKVKVVDTGVGTYVCTEGGSKYLHPDGAWLGFCRNDGWFPSRAGAEAALAKYGTNGATP